MRFLSFRSALLTVVAVVLVGGISIALWLGVNPSPLQPIANVSALPETAMFVPKQTPFMASIVVNAEQLQRAGLDALSSVQRQQAKAAFKQIQRRVDTQFGLDYRTDILPWIGDELTVALTSWDIDRNPDNGATPGYLLAVSVGDEKEAATALQRLWQKQSRSGKQVVENYSGVTITFVDGMSGDGATRVNEPLIATAQVGRHYVLFSNSPKVLKNAVNTLQASQLSLGNSPLYQETVSRLPEERIGLVWLNVPEAKTWWGLHHLAEQEALEISTQITQTNQANELAGIATETIAADSLAADSLAADSQSTTGAIVPASRAVDIVATSLAIAPGGMVADTVLTPTSGASFSTHVPHPLESLSNLQYVPNDSSLVLTSHALSEAWDMLTQFTAQGNPLARHITHNLNERQKQWPFPIGDDGLPWAIGDYAIARGPNEIAVDDGDPDWVFVIPSSEESEQAIQQLDAIAQQQGLNVDALPIDGQMTSVWTRLQAVLHTDTPTNPVSLSTEVIGIHAAPNDRDILATSVSAIGKALLLQDTNLATSTVFQDAIAALDPQNDGYLYTNWDLAQTTLTKAFPRLTPFLEAGQPLLRPMKSLVMTRYESHPEFQQWGTMLLF